MVRRTDLNTSMARRTARAFGLGAVVAAAAAMLPAAAPADAPVDLLTATAPDAPVDLLAATAADAPVDLLAVARDRAIAEIERAVAAGDPVTLDWKTMAALDYNTGRMPESLRKLNGVEVRIPGFMVPLEDTETRVTEFLLVPYFGACIHTPPPPPNQMVHVLMERNQTIDVNLWDPIWVVGTLKIENVESPYGVVGFQATGERILPYDG